MYQYYKDILPSGLRVVTVEMPHLHTAALVGYIKIGSRYENHQTNGLSHFLEHMLFRGTKSFEDAYQLNDTVESLGGTLNATTCRDYTYFETRLPPESLFEIVQIFGEIFTSPRFVKLDTEKQAVLEELSGDLDEDGNLICIDSLSRLTLFPKHPLGYTILGSKENIQNFENTLLRKHFQKHYTAKNIVLCAAGPIQRQDFLHAVQSAFADLPVGELIQSGTPGEHPKAPDFYYTKNQGSQTQLSLSFLTVGDLHPDFLALQLLWRILDDGMGARLHRRIYDDLGLAYEISAGLDPFTDIGVFDVDAAVRHENAPRLIHEVLGVLRNLSQTPPSEEELKKAKRRYLLDLHSTQDSPEGMAGWFGGSELFHPPDDFTRRMEKINAFDVSTLCEVASTLFRPENLHVTAVGDLEESLQKECHTIITNWS